MSDQNETSAFQLQDDQLVAEQEVGVRSYLDFFWAAFVKQFTLLLRYPVNTISQLGTVVVLFLLLFYGGKAVAPVTLSDALSGLVVGYLLWTLSTTAYSSLAYSVTTEAQWGTLEQLFMSPLGFGPVMVIITFVRLIEAFIWSVAVLLVLLVVTGQSISLAPLTAIPIAILAVAPAIGIGLIFGGLAVRFKRIDSVFQLVQFAFVALIAAPTGKYPILKWLPLSQGSNLLQRAMSDGVSITAIPTGQLGILVATAIGYLLLGYVIFMYCQRWARREGVMGHY